MSRETKLMMISIECDADDTTRGLHARLRWGDGPNENVTIVAMNALDMAWFLTHEIVKAFRR